MRHKDWESEQQESLETVRKAADAYVHAAMRHAMLYGSPALHIRWKTGKDSKRRRRTKRR